MKRLVAVLMATLIVGLFPRFADAHPGRLDERGCHKVWKDWQSQDGKRVYKAGTRHCHRVSDEVRLGQDAIVVEEHFELLQKGRDRAKEKK